MLGSHVIEETVEKKFAEHQLIATADFTGNPGLKLDNFRFVDKPKSTEHSLATLELLELHGGHGFLKLILDLLDLRPQLHLLGVLFIQLRQPWRVVQGVRKKTGFENLDFLRSQLATSVMIASL